jgi:hypothetical protein
MTTFYFSDSSFPTTNLEGQVPVFTSPRKRMTQLHLQTLGSRFVPSYDSQSSGTEEELRVILGSSLYSLCVEADFNISTVALQVVGGNGNGTHCLGVFLGHPVPGGFMYGDLALQGGGVSNLRE